MSGYIQVFTEPVAERSTVEFTLQLDDTNNPVDTSQLFTVTLSLYEASTKQTINGRNGVDIKNANGGSFNATGLLTLTLSDADNVIVLPARASESHVALISWTWASGAKTGRKELHFTVPNQPKVS